MQYIIHIKAYMDCFTNVDIMLLKLYKHLIIVLHSSLLNKVMLHLSLQLHISLICSHILADSHSFLHFCIKKATKCVMIFPSQNYLNVVVSYIILLNCYEHLILTSFATCWYATCWLQTVCLSILGIIYFLFLINWVPIIIKPLGKSYYFNQLQMLQYYYVVMLIIPTLITTWRAPCALNCKAHNCFSDV